jgi:hypothetical protein
VRAWVLFVVVCEYKLLFTVVFPETSTLPPVVIPIELTVVLLAVIAVIAVALDVMLLNTAFALLANRERFLVSVITAISMSFCYLAKAN